jgi:pimeloyl-ACP methyl ester carboxylesterase
MDRQDLNIIQLPDGRKLAYAEYGDSQGVPVFFFHGFPGSRYDGEYSGQVAAEMGIRLIAPDRPGMGYSDYQPNRRLLDWPADVGHLADTLGLDKFGVLGYSGGATGDVFYEHRDTFGSRSILMSRRDVKTKR